jgi:hypothetical protein
MAKRLARLRTVLAMSLWAATGAGALAAPVDGYRETVVPFFKAHCVDCHVGDEPEGDFSIARRNLGTDFSVAASRQQWLEVLDVLGAHSMPPEDSPQPSAEAVAAVTDWIRSNVAAAERAARANTPVLRRLNRSEYQNTIRDLVGIDFDVSGFPQDPPAGGFDNNGGALTLSPLQLELTLDAAEAILERAIVEGEQPEPVRWRFDPVEGSAGDRVRMRIDDRNNPIVNGGNNVHQGDWVMIHHASWDKTINARDFRLPTAGDYVIRMRLAGRTPSRKDVVATAEAILAERRDEQDAKAPDRAKHHAEQFERDLEHFRTDRMYDYGPPRAKLVLQLGSQPRTVAEFDVEGTTDEPQVVEQRVRCTTDSVGITIEYAYEIPAVLENFWMQRRDAFARPELLVDWIEIEGPLNETWPPAAQQKILFASTLRESNEPAYAAAVLERFMNEAFRRPVDRDEVNGLMPLFASARSSGASFEQAIRQPLAAVLASPHFLYLVEPAADNGTLRRLSGHELAARLSYFLWSSQPDPLLRHAADAGQLADPSRLAFHVERMLADPKAEQLIENFAGQWLRLREVGANPPAADLFPRYDRHLEISIVEESKAYMRTFLEEDLDVRQMLASDFVTINERLARFYGIPGVKGDEFRSVTTPDDVHRGGLMTQASMLTITSNGTRTSPVKRGTWLLRTLLGDDPGLPVANAGEIAPEVPGIDKATVRQRLEAHRSLAQCARCHAKIDPLGFALENYDASGEWRLQEGFGYKGRIGTNDPVIDASGTLPDGTEIDSVEDLQAALLARSDDFVEALARSLLTYALGRELSLADEPALEQILKQTASSGHTLRALIHAIIHSEPFTTT